MTIHTFIIKAEDLVEGAIPELKAVLLAAARVYDDRATVEHDLEDAENEVIDSAEDKDPATGDPIVPPTAEPPAVPSA